MGHNQRMVSAKQAEKIRDSIKEGVDRIVKPFLKRVEAQRKVQVKDNIRIR